MATDEMAVAVIKICGNYQGGGAETTGMTRHTTIREIQTGPLETMLHN